MSEILPFFTYNFGKEKKLVTTLGQPVQESMKQTLPCTVGERMNPCKLLEDSLNALTLDLTIHHPNRGWWSKEEHSRQKMLQSYTSEEGQAQRELCFSKGVTHMCACRKMDVQGCSFQIVYIRKPEIRQKPSVEGWLYKSWSFLQKVPVNHTHTEQISEEVWREP